MKKGIIALTFCLLALGSLAQKTEVLLIGTFHFSNPGLDLTKLNSMDILSPERQAEIAQVRSLITKFKPDKFFVEYRYNQQQTLDSIYSCFLQGKSTAPLKNTNEVYQLAFKTGKEVGLKRISAIDFNVSLPFDSLMATFESRGQVALRDSMLSDVKRFEQEFNRLVLGKRSILDILLYLNTPQYRKWDLGFYTTLVTKAGQKSDLIGPFIASEWYRRNITMLSILQKTLEPADQRVVVLLGASHISLLEQLLRLDPSIKIVELRDLM
jgi:hypothetical protein